MLESIAEEPYIDPNPSAASTCGLLDDMSVLEINELSNESTRERRGNRKSRSRDTLSRLFHFGGESATPPAANMPAK